MLDAVDRAAQTDRFSAHADSDAAMTRYRASLFGNPIAPWRGSKDLAQQDAVDAGEASRTDGGWVYTNVGLEIEEAEGEVPFTPDQERWAEALAVIRMHGARAEAHCDERLRNLADDPAGRARWRQIRDRVREVRAANGLDRQ